MKVSGEPLGEGVYIFKRYVCFNGEKKLKSTYKIESTKDGYVLLESTEKIDEYRKKFLDQILSFSIGNGSVGN